MAQLSNPIIIGAIITSSVVIVAAIAGFVSALFSSSIKSKGDRQRELLGWAIQAAIEDFKADNEVANGPHEIPPLSTYTYFHFNYFKLLESKKATPKRVHELAIKSEEVANALQGKIWRIAAQQRLQKSQSVPMRTESESEDNLSNHS